MELPTLLNQHNSTKVYLRLKRFIKINKLDFLTCMWILSKLPYISYNGMDNIKVCERDLRLALSWLPTNALFHTYFMLLCIFSSGTFEVATYTATLR